MDRGSRETIRESINKKLRAHNRYQFGKPLELPFQTLYPFDVKSNRYYDLQIEGVGTKTLLAELHPKGYSTIGIDGVAMAANDVVRSGARILLISDAIHIAKSHGKVLRNLIAGVQKGAELSGATLASGETGDVAEILHSRRQSSGSSVPFDLMVSALGTVEKQRTIWGRVAEGDEVIGLDSSGIHSNGLTLARKVLLKNWGGLYDPYKVPDGLDRPLIEELLIPTRIYAKAVERVGHEIELKAALHVTGDGLAKFHRLCEFVYERNKERIGFEFDSLGPISEIFKLIQKASKAIRKPIADKEMFRTFNMGVGFAVAVAKEDLDDALARFNKYTPARRIGRVISNPSVSIAGFKARRLRI